MRATPRFSFLFRRLFAVAACVAVLLCASSPSHRAEDGETPLAYELTRLRQAWLLGDDSAAAARLDALRNDNRLSGELPRWAAYLRAWLALEQRDTQTALDVLETPLKAASDAREYVRAVRLLLLFGDEQSALALVRQGIARAPGSVALRRLEAGLLWLSGAHAEALDAYSHMVTRDARPNYPYVAPWRGRWQDAPPFATGQPPADAAQPAKVEPFADLFAPLHWYNTDLPGLDRCISEMAMDAKHVAAMTVDLATLAQAARSARERINNLRTGDAAEREQLEKAARAAEFKAACAARVVVRSHLAAARSEQAEKIARSALEVAPDDVALLDLHVQALAQQGRAEESRSGPMARLRSLANLWVYTTMVTQLGPQNEAPDRVFAGALALYRINPEAGRKQFQELMTVFGAPDRATPVRPAALGLWLYAKNEPELARVYLQEASRVEGFLSGRPMRPEVQPAELALIELGEGKDDASEPDDPREGGGKPAVPEEGGEGVDVGRLDQNAHPLLRAAPRAGALSASLMDARGVVYRLSGAQIWGSYYGARPLWTSQRAIPNGERTLQNALYELPARIAAEVPAAELDAALAPGSALSQSLSQNLESFGESLMRLKGAQDLQTRNSVTQKAQPVLGLLEARAILLRARLQRDKPADLKALADWLKQHQSTIDLRKAARATSEEAYVLMDRERKQAAIPEVVHSGILLDAAVLLANAGLYAEAARLVWYNRDVPQGIQALEPLATLAAIFATRGKDEMLAARLKLLAASGLVQQQQVSQADKHPLVLELPYTLKLLRAHGSAADLLAYLELHVIPDADSEVMRWVANLCPELKDAPESLLLRNASEVSTFGIFEATINYASCAYVRDSWFKMLQVDGENTTTRRFAAWTLVSDLGVSRTSGRPAGLADAADVVMGWVMLLQLHEHDGQKSPAARAHAARLRRLLLRCASPTEELVSFHPELFR
ncbi:MAG: hypothetical protein IT464_06765 [Planctomycetes bacterium]|nr:hypothetical protein [Planctomycetota bacterium]